MVRYIFTLVIVVLLASCGSATKSQSKRGLMLLDQTELPRNAKFVSPKYQQKLKKSMKSHQKEIKKRYKRAGK